MSFDPSTYLKRFGWKEGGGLGKNEDGRKTFIRVQKREDKHGIGPRRDWAHSFDDVYARAAANVGQVRAKQDADSEARKERKRRRKEEKRKKRKKARGEEEKETEEELAPGPPLPPPPSLKYGAFRRSAEVLAPSDFCKPLEPAAADEAKAEGEAGRKAADPVCRGVERLAARGGLHAGRSRGKMARIARQEARAGEIVAKLHELYSKTEAGREAGPRGAASCVAAMVAPVSYSDSDDGVDLSAVADERRRKRERKEAKKEAKRAAKKAAKLEAKRAAKRAARSKIK